MIAAFDTFYSGDEATTAAILFNWTDSRPSVTKTHTQKSIEPYIPGQFYRKELPCILETLEFVQTPELIVVDSYVYVDDNGSPGLGAHLYNKTQIPVIGVAKNPFNGVDKLHRRICRGGSQRPLYISAVGYDLDEAAQRIKEMHGEYRLPTLLKLVDSLGRAGD